MGVPAPTGGVAVMAAADLSSALPAELRADAVVLLGSGRILAARGFDVPDSVRERIMSCTDPAVLERWVDKAVTAASLEDVLPGDR